MQLNFKSLLTQLNFYYTKIKLGDDDNNDGDGDGDDDTWMNSDPARLRR